MDEKKFELFSKAMVLLVRKSRLEPAGMEAKLIAEPAREDERNGIPVISVSRS